MFRFSFRQMEQQGRVGVCVVLDRSALVVRKTPSTRRYRSLRLCLPRFTERWGTVEFTTKQGPDSNGDGDVA